MDIVYVVCIGSSFRRIHECLYTAYYTSFPAHSYIDIFEIGLLTFSYFLRVPL